MEYVLDEATQCFRLLTSEVMATSKWEKTEKENPQMLFDIQKFLLSKKLNDLTAELKGEKCPIQYLFSVF